MSQTFDSGDYPRGRELAIEFPRDQAEARPGTIDCGPEKYVQSPDEMVDGPDPGVELLDWLVDDWQELDLGLESVFDQAEKASPTTDAPSTPDGQQRYGQEKGCCRLVRSL